MWVSFVVSDALREKVGILDSQKSELERLQRTAAGRNLEENQASRNASMLEFKQELAALKADNFQLERDLHHSRSRIQAMQVDLDNSEAVQLDFVKLSQSLQVWAIRASSPPPTRRLSCFTQFKFDCLFLCPQWVRHFVQVELEKIRQSENEVRWQFDDDVHDCNACGQPFLLPKKKVRSLKVRAWLSLEERSTKS